MLKFLFSDGNVKDENEEEDEEKNFSVRIVFISSSRVSN